MEYYLYKGAENKLVNLSTALRESGASNNPIANPTILPVDTLTQWSIYGKEEVPPINYADLPAYLYKSETHSACINFKHRNTVGKGFNFHNREAEDFYNKVKNKLNERNENLYDVISKMVYSFYNNGQAYLEVVGSKNDFNLYNSSPTNFKALLNKYGNKVMFYAYDYTKREPKFIKAFYDGSPYFRFLFSLRMPNDWSQFYGVPDWISAIQSIDTNYSIDTWIQSFVENSARFDFLLVTQGQQLNKQQEEKVKTVLTGAKGVTNAGKGGYLNVDYDTKVQVVQLNAVNHSSFFDGKGEYIQQIIQSHGLSSQSVGFSNGGNSIAGNEATGALRKDAETYITPMQIFIENNINKLFTQITGINPDFRFARMDVVSDKEKAVIRDADVKNRIAPPSYFTRTNYADLTKEELAELQSIKDDDKKQNEKQERTNFEEKPDSFDDTQNYERADRR